MNLRSHLRRFNPIQEISEDYSSRAARRRPHGWTLALLAAAAMLALPGIAPGKEKTLDKMGRFKLIRGLDREIAVTKIALPLGKHGVFVNGQGQVDEDFAQKELRAYGPAVKPGMPVEITKIKFKPNRIIFVINGGKRHKKWYQHIQIVGAGVSQPTVQRETSVISGSYITLTFADGKVPDLSVEQTKKLLHNVLDFHRHSPTVLYSPSLPKKFKEAIKEHRVLVGMNRDAVLSAKGPPFRKIRQTKPNGEETEDWLYGLPPHTLFVTFEGDSVIKVHQY